MAKQTTDSSYRKLLTLMLHSKRHLVNIMEQMKMTPTQGMLLMLFEDKEGKSMNELSYLMGCDASNITGLVERLDAQDLIERTADPRDKRVKLIKLSDKGVHCRKQILKHLKSAEAIDFQLLSEAEREHLSEITDKLVSKARDVALT